MIEFTIDGKDFRADKLHALQQFHVSRKIAPLIPSLIPVFLKVAQMKGGLTDNLQAIAEFLQPFADGLASLPDKDAEYVFSTCLSVVRRKQGDHWAAVWSASANTMMFDDINDLGKIIPIVVRVIQDNLGPFISGLLTSQKETSAVEAKSPGTDSPAGKSGSSPQ